MSPLFTIGYEKAAQPDVLAALHEAGVKVVIDVRAIAASRRAGFSKSILRASLAEAGIDYVHLRGLGTPAEGRLAARENRLADLKTIYDAHLAGAEAVREAADLAERIAAGPPPCLLCYEHEPHRCHRQILADRVRAQLGCEIRHLAPKIPEV